jgi:hypothetical protein
MTAEHCPGILAALGAWISHLKGDPELVCDPFAERARRIWQTAGRDGVAEAMFGPRGIFAAAWKGDPNDLAA